MKNFILFGLLLLGAARVQAQMPSESLLIINGNSLDAMETAHLYARWRNFPSERILVLYPPASFFRLESGLPRWMVPVEAAKKELLEPVKSKLRELDDPSPTALILSPDWPTRIKTGEQQNVSSTAYLSVDGQLPKWELIKSGRALSPWFSPPPDTPQKSAQLKRYPLRGALPSVYHPAAMLGVFYHPSTNEKVQEHLKNAVEADFRQPIGSIVFETNNDVRTRTRLRQYQLAESRLKQKDIPVAMLSASMPLPEKIIGVMGGKANMQTDRYAGRLQPGAFADHLTSHAATFDVSIQTKLTKWLEAGAAGSAGTITEPYSIWTKFPEAAVFERYLRGLTLLEALMQSIASPYQVLIVGDPLCRPWAKELSDLKLQSSWNENTLIVRAEGITASSLTQLHLFANGVRVEGDGPEWELELDSENTGPEVELILHARYLWAPPQLGSVRTLVRSPFPEELSLTGSVKKDHVLLKIKCKAPLVLLDIYRGDQKIHHSPVEGKKVEVPLGLNQSGTGPVQLRAKAVTTTGTIVWSEYLDLSPKPPR